MNLKKKIFLQICLLMLLIFMIAFSLLSYYLLIDHRGQEIASAKSKAFALVQTIEKIIMWYDYSELETSLKFEVENFPICEYVFIEMHGRIISYTFDDGVPPALLKLHEFMKERSEIKQFQDQNGNVFYDIAVRGEKIGAIIHYGISENEIDNHALSWLISLSVVFFVIFCVAIFLSYKFATFITSEERKKSIEIQRLQNYLSNIIDSMPSMLVGIGTDIKVTQWNIKAQQITGITPKEAKGQPLEQALPYMASKMERVREAIQMKTVCSDPRQSRVVEGETIYEDMTIYPLIANGIDGAVIRIDDVTEKVRIEEIMVQSEKMLSVGGLAAGMAHEINNPLAGMMHTSFVLNDRLTNLQVPENIRAAKEAGVTMEAISTFMESRGIIKMAERIRESGSRAAKILSNMQSFVDESKSVFSSHNIAELLDESVDLVASNYDLKKKYDFHLIKIIREFEDNLPNVVCEESIIRQVFLNILTNGTESIHERQMSEEHGAKGKKSVEPCFVFRLINEKEVSMVRIEIEDNGSGMDETIRKRVFEPFFTTKPTDQGTGLGLSVSYFIIKEKHGGEMSVESKTGKGTKFIIRLPIERMKL